ncbi:MAG: response regulator transcription factor [Acidobacteria bacterium]|nr:response regulator transcription factor [Acidobacteriota bacterium]
MPEPPLFPLRVLILADDPLAREALAARLHGERGVTIATHTPDVVLWDLGSDAVSATPLSPDAAPDLPILGSVAGDAGALEALASGARGVILRDAPAPRLAAALRSIARGLVVIDEPLAAALLRPVGTPHAEGSRLTRREIEVLQLLALGLPSREIGERLFISERTAKFHVSAILGKLGARTRTEAVVRAARLGLVSI